jgi:hypothetical protein
MRKMETSSCIAPSTADTAITATNTEKDTDRNFRLDFEDMQKITNLVLRNNVLRFHRIYMKTGVHVCWYRDEFCLE